MPNTSLHGAVAVETATAERRAHPETGLILYAHHIAAHAHTAAHIAATALVHQAHGRDIAHAIHSIHHASAHTTTSRSAHAPTKREIIVLCEVRHLT